MRVQIVAHKPDLTFYGFECRCDVTLLTLATEFSAVYVVLLVTTSTFRTKHFTHRERMASLACDLFVPTVQHKFCARIMIKSPDSPAARNVA